MRLYISCILFGFAVCISGLLYEGFYGKAGVMFACMLLIAWASRPLLRAPKPVPDYNCKESTCCPGELLVPMHSTDTKMCTGCKTEKHWPLEPGQKRTFE